MTTEYKPSLQALIEKGVFPYPTGSVIAINSNPNITREYDTDANPLYLKLKEQEQIVKSVSADKLVQLIEKDKKLSNREVNRVVCAANYYPGFPMILGPRHWDTTMHEIYERMEKEHEAKRVLNPELQEFPAGHHFAQGFIDKHGRWLTREEAWVIAETAGQIIQRVGGDESNGGRLYSENLY